MKTGIHAFSWGFKQAQELAKNLQIPCRKIDEHKFPDGETLVTVTPPAATAILYAELGHPDEKLFPLLLAADALRRGGAKRLVLVAPYLCYMRQDKAFKAGQDVSQQVIGKLFAGCFDRIVTVDAHLHRTPDIADVFPGIEAVNLSPAGLIADDLRRSGCSVDTVIVGPDGESEPFVAGLAKLLGFEHMVGKKIRRDDHSVEIKFPDPGVVKNRPADDIVSSGATIMVAAQAILAAGAKSVDVVVTHALFPDGLMKDFTRGGIHSVRSTDSVPHPTNSISLVPLLAPALYTECREGSR